MVLLRDIYSSHGTYRGFLQGQKAVSLSPLPLVFPEYISSWRGDPDGEFRFFNVECTVTDN